MSARRSSTSCGGSSGSREITHSDPVRRDRADFIIAAPIGPDDGSEVYHEQLWAHQLSPTTFELSCIPFNAYALALGDIVEAKPDGYVITRVVSASGHYTFRAWLADAADDHARDSLLAGLRDLSTEWEWMSPRLVAIGAADEETAGAVAGVLAEKESLGELVYETGRSS